MSSPDADFPFRFVAVCLTLLLAAGCQPSDDPPIETGSQAEEVANDYIDAYNDRDRDRLTELIAPAVVYGGEETDRDALLAAIEAFWEAFPDITLEPTHVVADEEWAAIRIEFSGTHEGEFAGLEPTGESAESSEIMLFRIRNDQISEYWYAWDELGFYQQLGVVEPSMP